MRALALLLSLAAAVSCGDPATPDEPVLSTEEIDGLARLAVETGLFPSPLPPTQPWPCPEAGIATRQLVFAVPEPGTTTRRGAATWVGCGQIVAGRQLTITGTLTVDDSFVQEGGVIVAAQGTYAGTLDWEVGARSGSCEVALAVSVENGGLVVAGTVCEGSVRVEV